MKSAQIIISHSRFFAISFVCTILLLGACTSDQLPQTRAADCSNVEATYSVDIKPLIDGSCAYSGCHLDNSPGRFDDYVGLLPYLEDNTFRQRVIIEQADPTTGMPPNYAPEDRPRDLSLEELILIECWLDAGFPE